MSDETLVKMADDVYEDARGICHVLINRAAIPAPLVYDLTGNLKAGCWSLADAVGHMSRGLPPSLEAFDVYDNKRDPAESVAAAVDYLHSAEAAIRLAGQKLELAQQAINQQGHHGPKTADRAAPSYGEVLDGILSGEIAEDDEEGRG